MMPSWSSGLRSCGRHRGGRRRVPQGLHTPVVALGARAPASTHRRCMSGWIDPFRSAIIDPRPRGTMGRLIYSAIASVDGYIADEHGEFGWAAPDAEVH